MSSPTVSDSGIPCLMNANESVLRNNARLSAMYFLALFLLLINPAPLRASDGIPNNCEYANGAHYRPNAFPRFEPLNARLVLVDWTTGQDIFEIEASIPEPVVRVMGWSHDCRYLGGLVGSGTVSKRTRTPPFEWLGDAVVRWNTDGWEDTQEPLVVIWDTVAGGRVFSQSAPYDRRGGSTVPTVLLWSPVENLAIVRTPLQFGFYRPDTNSYTPISVPYRYGGGVDFRQGWYWDYSRNQLLLGGGLSAIDLNSGQTRATCDVNGSIVVSPEAKFLAVFRQPTLPFGWEITYQEALRLCDLETLETWTLDYVGNFYPQQIAFSPDNRYLVVARDIIRVWDTSSRVSLYTVSSDVGRIERITFVDMAHFQTVDIEGFVQTRHVATGEIAQP